VKIWVGVTDKDWFEHLTLRSPDEVNFWQPSGNRTFRVLQAGEPFLFKLHSPNNFIVGGGFFVRYSALPASLAWDAFELKNGVASFAELLTRIRKYRRSDDFIDPIIGCNVLAEPFFLPRDKWVPIPSDWAGSIVSGKSYDTQSPVGSALWDSVNQARLAKPRLLDPSHVEMDPDALRFGADYLTRGRLGQGAFRVLVTDAYQRRCAVTGEKTLPVLEAAHIKPYSEKGPHQVKNGILLRSDLHKLFDLGYVTITPQLRLKVSPRLKEDWQNGREYYAHDDCELSYQPPDAISHPGKEFLQWHNENRFKA
jgi:putative restriction endonuclease